MKYKNIRKIMFRTQDIGKDESEEDMLDTGVLILRSGGRASVKEMYPGGNVSESSSG